MSRSETKMRLTAGIVGLGHVGLPLATLLTVRGFNVVGYDCDEKKVLQIRRGDPTFYEPSLEKLLQEALLTNRMYLTSEQASLVQVDVPIITIGTPWDDAKHRPDFSQLDLAVDTLGRNLRRGSVVILKSTVPPGTTEKMVIPRLESLSGLELREDFGVAFSPERMIEGQAISDYQTLPKIIGAVDERSYEIASAVLGTLGGAILRVSSLRSAEMVKMLDNYNRDGSIALINQFALICMVASVDVLEVIRAAQFEYPRNKGLLIPGGGVGGSCLNKDPWILSHFAHEHGVDTDLISAFRSVNSNMPIEVVRVAKAVIGRLGLKTTRILVAGLAFKGGTDDTRYSPGIIVCRELSKLGHEVIASDPYLRAAQGLDPKTAFVPDILQAAAECRLAIFVADHDLYRNLDLRLLKKTMGTPAGLVDARHVIDPVQALSLGFDFEGIGRPKKAFL
jgi:UDP-N-acetyl-D-mannosaminuronic acid dehydrogenase